MKKQTGSRLGKECIKDAYCHPAYLTYAEHIKQNARLDDSQAEIKFSNNLTYANNTNLTAENINELKSLLMKVKEESEKAGLKLSIQKKKIMAFNPITSWQIDGEIMETVTGFIFLGSNITIDDKCSHEMKRNLFLRRKTMTKLDSILSREINSLTKGPSSQRYGFSTSHILYESWTIRKAEC